MSKKLTINDLARMTQEEFARVGERFDAVDQRFTAIDQRFDGVDRKLERLAQGQEVILKAVLDLPSKRAIAQLAHKVDDLDERVTTLEKKGRK